MAKIPLARYLISKVRTQQPSRVSVNELSFAGLTEDAAVLTPSNRFSEVITFHGGKTVIRNCRIHGAITIEVDESSGALVITGMANTVIEYIPPW